MKLHLSSFGKKLGHDSGIQELMDDLGKAMQQGDDTIMLGGGNPVEVPEISALWRQRMQEILNEPDRFDRMLLKYDTPRGRPAFMDGLATYFQQTHGWDIQPENIFVTNGSQTAFFYLFNLLAGTMPDGRHRKILLPMMPEYIGYADQGLQPELFVSSRPSIEQIDERRFKYHVDFDHLPLDDSIAALAVSRPTNPTGNVLSNEELTHLSELAREQGIPLIVDNAYGSPFPNILFSDIQPQWAPHIIYALSLSKLGLPGTRTGIIIAAKEVVDALARVNAISGLATGNIGQELVAPLLANGELARLCETHVTPFYRVRAERTIAIAHELLPEQVPWKLHVCEGAMFLWLWCEGLPISSRELYDRLLARGVLVVSGHYFFYGLNAPWQHAHECLRIHYAQDEEKTRQGLQALAEELSALYA